MTFRRSAWTLPMRDARYLFHYKTDENAMFHVELHQFANLSKWGVSVDVKACYGFRHRPVTMQRNVNC